MPIKPIKPRTKDIGSGVLRYEAQWSQLSRGTFSSISPFPELKVNLVIYFLDAQVQNKPQKENVILVKNHSVIRNHGNEASMENIQYIVINQ